MVLDVESRIGVLCSTLTWISRSARQRSAEIAYCLAALGVVSCVPTPCAANPRFFFTVA